MYEQAFHTCCRSGLTTPTLAFQFQAASPGFDPERLQAIARVMVGYVPPPAAPPAPSIAELSQFPKSLRYLDVAGVGPSVSQTVYVGREDRDVGDGGRGRFGNYFSHVISAIGQPALDANRHPIEMWASTAWLTDFGGAPAEALATIPSGAISVQLALEALVDSVRSAWLPFVFDSLGAAMADRSRIIVLDDAAHAWAWIAAVALSLPRALGRMLTFDTYTGEPDRSLARICVADPRTDRSLLARRTLTGELSVVDLDSTPPEPKTLLGRVVAAQVRTGNPAELSQMATSLASSEVDDFAALLAVRVARPGIVTAEALPTLLRRFKEWAESPGGYEEDLEGAGRLLDAALDDEVSLTAVDAETMTDLLKAEVTSRRHVPQAFASAISRIILRLPEQASLLPLRPVNPDAISSELIGDAIALCSDAEAPMDTVMSRLGVLEKLGLIGVNSGLDRRIGRAASRWVEEMGVGDWLGRIAARESGRTIAETVMKAAAAKDPLPASLLPALARPPLQPILSSLVGPQDDFPLAILRAVADTAAYPARRAEHFLIGFGFASKMSEAQRLIDALYGPAPWDIDAIAEILSGFSGHNRPPTEAFLSSAWVALERVDLAVAGPSAHELSRNLRQLDPNAPERSIEIALRALERLSRTGKPRPLFDEIVRSADRLRPVHRDALLRRVVRQLGRITPEWSINLDHEEIVRVGVETFRRQFIACYTDEMSRVLGDTSKADLAAVIIYAWGAADRVPLKVSDEMLGQWLPETMHGWRQQERERVGEALMKTAGDSWLEWWNDWCDDFPPAGVIGRGLGKLRRRRDS
jgi:hypothetical protein